MQVHRGILCGEEYMANYWIEWGLGHVTNGGVLRHLDKWFWGVDFRRMWCLEYRS